MGRKVPTFERLKPSPILNRDKHSFIFKDTGQKLSFTEKFSPLMFYRIKMKDYALYKTEQS